MTLNWANLAAMAVLVAAGCTVTYTLLQRTLRRTIAERQQAAERQLSALATALKALEVRVAERERIPELQAAAAPEIEVEAAVPAAMEPVEHDNEEVTSEILAVIDAAVTAFLGRKVRILSAKMLQSPHEVVNAWSQQGRVFVQASHNLRSRG